MVERFSYDSPKITRDEATELCVWHLRTAAALFQFVPDDGNKALKAEIERQTKGDLDEVDKRWSALLWAMAMLKAYENMKDGD